MAVMMTAICASAQVVDQNGQVVDTTSIYGERADSLEAAVFTTRQAGNYLSKMKEVRTEVISAAGLCKMACCNLAESFENSASVTVGYSDAVTGARQIREHPDRQRCIVCHQRCRVHDRTDQHGTSQAYR